MKRMEQEMEQVFEMKVREKMQKLKDSEIDVCLYTYKYNTLLLCRKYFLKKSLSLAVTFK